MALSDRTPGIRPHQTVGRRLDIAWRYAFPAATSVLFMLLSLAPFGLWGQAALLPVVALTCVWFWSLFRPAAMVPPVVLLIGVLLDLVGFLPLGVGGLTMLATHGLAHRLRRFLSRQGFTVVWLIFMTVACGIAAMNWALVSLLTLTLVPPGPVLFQAGLAVAMYPVVAIPLMLAHRTIADPERA
ncbi:MAG: rod shape-determining protein MreD [Acetobacteraceae bacterium]|nr:rod shape-determining protein MreD [Acetobacteraceae bacterium]